MENTFRFDPIEARVLGVLIEKAQTTPDQYPMTLNALTNGTNQKVNRDPVMTLEEEEVWRALQNLIQKHVVEAVYPGGSRVEKYRHKVAEMIEREPAGRAVLAELMLRGPQTPGELRARAARMAPIETLEQLNAVLAPLIERGLVRRLPPAPGSRAERYAQLLSPDAHPIEAGSEVPAGSAPASAVPLASRVQALEEEVARLKDQVAQLAGKLTSTD